jgi:hypothetical protein
MKRAAVLSLALLFVSIPLTAQNASPHPAGTIIVLPPVTDGCPVALHARQLAWGGTLAARNGRSSGIGQWLHLTLTSPDSKPITGATVTVRGLTPKGRVTRTVANKDEPDRAVKTLSLTFSDGAGKTASSDLWIPGMTAAQAIDLNSVTYADGSTWKLPGNATCRIAPDPLMLIAADR